MQGKAGGQMCKVSRLSNMRHVYRLPNTASREAMGCIRLCNHMQRLRIPAPQQMRIPAPQQMTRRKEASSNVHPAAFWMHMLQWCCDNGYQACLRESCCSHSAMCPQCHCGHNAMRTQCHCGHNAMHMCARTLGPGQTARTGHTAWLVWLQLHTPRTSCAQTAAAAWLRCLATSPR